MTDTDRIPAAGGREESPGRLVVVSGPSGVGKSTIVREVLARTGAVFSVSATTRAPRPGETDGRDYHFVDRAAFEDLIARGEMLEWAEVFGQYYGTPAERVRQGLAAGDTVVLDIDVQGGLQVARKMPEATFVLILPPGEAELKRRLAGRGTEDPQAAERRFAQARQEIRAATDSGVYTHTVINADLDQAVDEVVRIVTEEQKTT